MPILVDYTPGMDLMNLASRAGTSQGTAAYMAQQRPLDAAVQRQAIEQAGAANARPFFAERNSQATPENYSTNGGVQTFVNDEARAQKAQYEAQYGNRAQQQARAAQAKAATEYAGATGGNPAAAGYYAGAIRRGEKVPPQIEAGTFGLPPAQQVAKERYQGEAPLNERKTAAQESNAKANMIRATRPTTAPMNMQETRIRGQNEQAAYLGPSRDVADGLMSVNNRDGGPSEAANRLAWALANADRSVEEKGARISELEAAGLHPEFANQLRAAIVIVEEKKGVARKEKADVKDTAATMAAGIAAEIKAGKTFTPDDIAKRAKRMGMSLDDLTAQIQQEWVKEKMPVAQ